MLGQMLNLPCSNLQKTMMVRVSWGERRILQARLKIYWERFGTGRTTDKETTVNTTGKVRLKAGKDTVQMALKERTHSTNVQVQGRKVKLYNTCFIWGSILDWIYIYIYTSGDHIPLEIVWVALVSLFSALVEFLFSWLSMFYPEASVGSFFFSIFSILS